MKIQKFAAIDIGSNSFKLAIAEATSTGSVKIIAQDRAGVRLGKDTLQKKCLSKEAISLSVKAISKFCSIAKSMGADSVIAVATAAVREAKNAREFVERVEAETGIHVEILSSLEEARLIGIAAAQYFRKRALLLNIDIGGGSTEISLMKNGEPKKLFSMKLGAVGLTEKFLLSDPIKKKELKMMKEKIQFALGQPKQKMKNERWLISTGTSGTVLSLASLLNFQNSHDSNDFNECPLINFERLAGLNKILSRLSLKDRANMPFISKRRAEVIVAGGQILESIMKVLEIKLLKPCPYALREGVIINYLHNHRNRIFTACICG